MINEASCKYRQPAIVLELRVLFFELGYFERDEKCMLKFIACALSTEADFFITGDRDFIEAQKLMDITIIPLSLFKKIDIHP